MDTLNLHLCDESSTSREHRQGSIFKNSGRRLYIQTLCTRVLYLGMVTMDSLFRDNR